MLSKESRPADKRRYSNAGFSSLGGVVVSVLDTDLRVAGSNPADAMDF
jgi:hypothetical protein